MSKAQGIAQSANQSQFKNRIINGNMAIDQRNAGAATASSYSGYTLDRWNISQTVTGKVVIQQNAGSVTPPTGFKNYLGATSQSAYSVLSGDYYLIGQQIEGCNVSDLGWGTASAQTITVSFWVRSSLTGTFGAAIVNNGYDYSYPFSYTISSANTWEQKTVTISGPTSGTWTTDNTAGLRIYFSIGTGTTYSGTSGAWTASFKVGVTGGTSVVGTSGATFYITGVQLEKGSVATSFDYRPYGTELALCQRYYEKSLPQSVAVANGFGDYRPWYGPAANGVPFAVVKRATPTMATYYGLSGSNGQWNQFNGGAWVQFTPDIGASTANWYFAGGSYNIIIGAWTASAEL